MKGSWTIDTIPEALALLPISLLFLAFGPRLLIGWSGLSSRLATRLLGVVDAEDLKREVAGVLARRGEADGFEILEELEVRLGRGSFLTATRVEAALLALELTGRVVVREEGRRAYRLAVAVG